MAHGQRPNPTKSPEENGELYDHVEIREIHEIMQSKVSLRKVTCAMGDVCRTSRGEASGTQLNRQSTLTRATL